MARRLTRNLPAARGPPSVEAHLQRRATPPTPALAHPRGVPRPEAGPRSRQGRRMTLLTSSAWRDGTGAMGAPCRCPCPACRRRGPRPAARTTCLPSPTAERGGVASTLACSHPISARAGVLTEGGQYTRKEQES